MTSSLPAILPEIVLLGAACAVLLLDLFLPRRAPALELLADAGDAARLRRDRACSPSTSSRRGTFDGLVVDDMLADVLKFLACLAVSLMLFYSRGYLAARDLFRGETFVLTLFALLGMMVMISAASFLTLYLGLELLALCLYAMVAMHRASTAASEAAMKYFVLGALASGMLLYGMSMIYGATGSLDIDRIARVVATGQANATILLFGLVFVVSGIAFKLGVVPYHMWVPDVYHGAPTAVTLLIGTAPKLAAFAFTLRLLGGRAGGARVRLAGDADRAVAAVDDPRQRRRDRADQHQADAGVLDDRQHGLHADGLPGGEPHPATARRCSTSSPTC